MAIIGIIMTLALVAASIKFGYDIGYARGHDRGFARGETISQHFLYDPTTPTRGHWESPHRKDGRDE